MNDQSALLWTEGPRVFFWGGGGGQLQFKVAVSDDSGVSNRRHRHRQRFLLWAGLLRYFDNDRTAA